jgi:hypothetical protein
MSSIKEVKKNATEDLTRSKKLVTKCKQAIEIVQKVQENLDEAAETGEITDGEYLESCNENKKRMEQHQGYLLKAEECVIYYTYLKKHGHHPKIEFSDSDSD